MECVTSDDRVLPAPLLRPRRQARQRRVAAQDAGAVPCAAVDREGRAGHLWARGGCAVLFQLLNDFIGNCLHLSLVRARRDDKEVCEGSYASQIEDCQIDRFLFARGMKRSPNPLVKIGRVCGRSFASARSNIRGLRFGTQNIFF